MLTASTRLALVRQLGSEHFAETFFATTAAELTADGWRRHEQHVEGAAPLTEEERNLEGIKAAEALESGGTGARRVQTSGHLSMEVGDGVVEALKGLAEGSEANLVQLVSFFSLLSPRLWMEWLMEASAATEYRCPEGDVPPCFGLDGGAGGAGRRDCGGCAKVLVL